MRFIQDGRPIGQLGPDGRVTLEGGEVIGTVWSNGQVVDHEGENVLALTSAGNVVFSSVQRDPMRFNDDGALLIEAGTLLEIDDGGNFRVGSDIVGIFVEGYDAAHRQTAFLAWLTLQFATIPWRRSLAAEPRRQLERIYGLIAAYATENGRLPTSSPATPSETACGRPAPWPEAPAGGFGEIGLQLSDPTYYSYELLVSGDEIVLRARGDIDCNGRFSRFELHAAREGEELVREPLLRVTEELE